MVRRYSGAECHSPVFWLVDAGPRCAAVPKVLGGRTQRGWPKRHERQAYGRNGTPGMQVTEPPCCDWSSRLGRSNGEVARALRSRRIVCGRYLSAPLHSHIPRKHVQAATPLCARRRSPRRRCLQDRREEDDHDRGSSRCWKQARFRRYRRRRHPRESPCLPCSLPSHPLCLAPAGSPPTLPRPDYGGAARQLTTAY